MNQVEHGVIRNNEVSGSGWNGINVQGGSHMLIEHNDCHDNAEHFGIQIITDHPEGDTSFYSGNVVRFNIVRRNKAGLYFRNNTDLSVYGNIIYDNTASGGYSGIHLGQDDGTSGSFDSNSRIFNNTIVGHEVSIYNQAFNRLEIRNNIFAEAESSTLNFSDDALSGHLIDFNLYHGPVPPEAGPSSVVGDPLFVAAPPETFQIEAESPARDAGVDYPELVMDLYGKPRPLGGGYDIGAVEYGEASQECSDGADNDADGRADFPDDSGCESPEDPDESDCGDGACEGAETCSVCEVDCGGCGGGDAEDRDGLDASDGGSVPGGGADGGCGCRASSPRASAAALGLVVGLGVLLGRRRR
jgi:hypothetical protein